MEEPFGISEQITVGLDLALKLAIIWEPFLVIGPTGFGFVGGFEVGKVAGQMAFDIEEIPSRESSRPSAYGITPIETTGELLSTKLERLDVQDVAAFVSATAAIEIAQVRSLQRIVTRPTESCR